MKILSFAKIMLLSVISLGLLACAHAVTGLYKASDFSLEKVKQEGLMVALVADSISGEKDGAVINYDAALARQLTDVLKFEIKSSNCISDTVKNNLREQVKTHADVTDAINATLKSAACTARYAIISRLERDEISQHREVRQDYLFMHNESAIVRQNDDVVVEIDFIKERKLTAGFWIIDRQTGAILWRGAVHDADQNVSHHSRIFPSMNMLSGLWADDYVSTLPEKNAALYPPPQSREQVWDMLSNTFAKQLK